MANLKPAMTPDEVKKAGISTVRNAYNDLAITYNKILDKELLMCSKCGEYLKADTAFYMDKNFATNRFHICKRCLLKMVEQRKSERDEPNETKESVQKVLQMMDKVYDDNFYNECVKGALDETNEKIRNSPFATYITSIQSLPQWKGKTWSDSDFGNLNTSISQSEINENSRILKAAKKRFGNNYKSEELMWLENEYQDWIKRYPCENKGQEVLYKQICFIELNIDKAQKEGKDTKDLLKSLQDVMTSLQIKPSQNNSNALTEAKTFGQLIAQWEEHDPIPEPDDDFKDVDNISEFIDVFMRGHLAKMMGLKNGYSEKYDSYIAEYSARKKEYTEDDVSSSLYDKIFDSNEVVSDE